MSSIDDCIVCENPYCNERYYVHSPVNRQVKHVVRVNLFINTAITSSVT